jgi:hypothetical protein
MMKKSDLLHIEYGEDIEHSRVKLDKEPFTRVNNIYRAIQLKRKRHEERQKRRRRANVETERKEADS